MGLVFDVCLYVNQKAGTFEVKSFFINLGLMLVIKFEHQKTS